MLFLTMTLICLPELIALLALLHYRFSVARTQQVVFLLLKDSESPSSRPPQSPLTVTNLMAQGLEVGEACTSDEAFRTWLAAVILQTPGYLCPACQQQIESFILKDEDGPACSRFWQQRYEAAKKQHRG